MGALQAETVATVARHRLQGLKLALRQGLRRAYYRAPLRYRQPLLQLAFRLRPQWFRHHPLYQHRQLALQPGQGLGLTRLSEQPEGPAQAPGRIAVHCHLFYPQLLSEFVQQLAVMPWPYDLYLSVPTEVLAERCREAFRGQPQILQLTVRVVANRGRDIAPMLVEFAAALASYDFVGHIQSKQSLYNGGATRGWREYLLTSLLGSAEQVRRIFGLFAADPKLGLVYPQSHAAVPYYAYSWLANRRQGAALSARLGLAMAADYFDFPAGSMFWARADCLRPLFELQLGLDDFPPERGQTDGTTAHALERLLGLVPALGGYRSCILQDEAHPSWSSFRLDQQYLSRTAASFARIVDDPAIQLVAFDIFDTLLVRPLLDPEHVKALVAARLAPADAELFCRARQTAEEQARVQAGRDVGLGAIYQTLQQITGCDAAQAARLRAEEEAVELASVAPREEVVAWLRRAVAAGRRVVLISDMFLERAQIEAMLAQHDIVGWQQLYLSSECGLRKDSGALYQRVLEQEGLRGEQLLMIGDNEQADLQLPSERYGCQVLHLLKARDLARALPAYRHWLQAVCPAGAAPDAAALNRELSAGLLVRRHLNKMADFSAQDLQLFGVDAFRAGFNVVGPVALAFCAWLLQQAKAEGIRELYFLAREGQLLKQVYDAWTQGLADAPRSHYLQVSRRAVNVPAVTGFEDVLAIAREVYHRGRVEAFLDERFGLRLDPARWAELEAAGLWQRDRPLEVQAGHTAGIEPLLRALMPEITAVAGTERQALMVYLQSVGLTDAREAAVVDVGYSGTIQKALNRLLGRPLHGYYLATSASVGQGLPAAARALGGYVDQGRPRYPGSRILSDSFELEKLFSADAAQVRHYLLSAQGQPQAQFKTLSQAEQDSMPVRAELRRGCQAYVDEAVAIRRQLHPGFMPSLEVADALYRGLIEARLGQAADVTRGITLDDDYCGRGLVS